MFKKTTRAGPGYQTTYKGGPGNKFQHSTTASGRLYQAKLSQNYTQQKQDSLPCSTPLATDLNRTDEQEQIQPEEDIQEEPIHVPEKPDSACLATVESKPERNVLST